MIYHVVTFSQQVNYIGTQIHIESNIKYFASCSNEFWNRWKEVSAPALRVKTPKRSTAQPRYRRVHMEQMDALQCKQIAIGQN